jgi:signal transduction histidine kinase
MMPPKKEPIGLDDDALRALGQLAAEMTHDLTNALGALTLRLDLLGKDPTCQEAQGENIEAVCRICAHAAGRVGQLQDFVSNAAKVKRSC